jgi:DNA repair exonuclease SbcCD ATPase subunit
VRGSSEPASLVATARLISADRETKLVDPAAEGSASDRLWELTERYRFDWQNETLQVVDHDNARQMRRADTLSGAETFLASLALALQLSEQVAAAPDFWTAG